MFADTDYFIDLMGGAAGDARERQNRAFAKGEQLYQKGTYLRVATPVVHELYYGVGFVAESADERRRIRNAIRSYPVVELTEDGTMKAGRMLGEIERKLGGPDTSEISQTDICVGALAIIADEPVLTRNVSDYRRMDDVDVESY